MSNINDNESMRIVSLTIHMPNDHLRKVNYFFFLLLLLLLSSLLLLLLLILLLLLLLQ